MPTYVHKCPDHGLFEQMRPMSRSSETAACPECKADCHKVPAVGTILIPGHFQTTLPTTGLRDNQGRSGGHENLATSFNKWNSGCTGPRNLKGRKIGNGLNY